VEHLINISSELAQRDAVNWNRCDQTIDFRMYVREDSFVIAFSQTVKRGKEIPVTGRGGP
jgi:hypothetical protein